MTGAGRGLSPCDNPLCACHDEEQARLDNHYGYCTLPPDHDGPCASGRVPSRLPANDLCTHEVTDAGRCTDCGFTVTGRVPSDDCTTCGGPCRTPYCAACGDEHAPGDCASGRSLSSTEEDAAMTPFQNALLAFLRADDIDAVIAEDRSHGTDWAGDSESGFYSTFSCELRWTTRTGEIGHKDYEGEDMERLWTFLMRWTP